MKKVLSIVSLVFVLYSCDKKVYFDIPQNEKPVLTNNDTVYFFCNKYNRIDTFIVGVDDSYVVSDKRYYHENIFMKYSNINKSSSPIKFSINRMESTNISVDGHYYPTIWGNEATIDLTMGGINYTSVYRVYDYDFPDTIPRLVYYSHTQGILKYAYSDTVYFEKRNK